MKNFLNRSSYRTSSRTTRNSLEEMLRTIWFAYSWHTTVIAFRVLLTILAISVRRPSILLPLTRRKSHLGVQRSIAWSQDMSKASRTGLLGMSTPLHLYITHLTIYILNRSLHWSYQTERYFGDKGMEIKRHRIVELLPVETEELPPSLTTKNSEVICAPTFSFGEKGALILVSCFSIFSPLVSSSAALRFYVYSAFITMTVFILSIIFDLHPSFDNFAKI